MSSKSGTLEPLELPVMPEGLAQENPEVGQYLSLVFQALFEWAGKLSTKVQEMESMSIDGTGLTLTIYPANATIAQRDGLTVLFDGDPNAGTPGAGTPGWYAWNSTSNSWVKM